MTQKKIQGNAALAKQIRLRRSELGLTIEEAASRAGVGTKTWCRYEAGESIRSDKCKGVCKALNWLSLPGQEALEPAEFSLEEYKDHEAWSRFLEDEFGTRAALSFAIGSDLLLDHLQEDMNELAAMPAGSHIGQLEVSFIDGFLPQQFLMHYTYEFLFPCPLGFPLYQTGSACCMFLQITDMSLSSIITAFSFPHTKRRGTPYTGAMYYSI